MNRKQQTPKNNWEIWFDEMFPCRHHASQCRGDCNGKIKDFIRYMFVKNVEEGTKMQKVISQPTHEVIKGAGHNAKLLQDVQSVMWNAVIKRDRGEVVHWITVAKEIISLVEKSKNEQT